MLLDRLDEGLHAGDRQLLQLLNDLKTLLGGNAAGASIGDQAVGPERAEVAAGGHIVWPQLKANAGGLKGATADFEGQRIVAEEPEMAGAGPRRDARQHRHARPEHTRLRQGIEIGGRGRLQFRQSARLLGKPAEAVCHEHHDLGVVFLRKFPHQIVFVHGQTPQQGRPGGPQTRYRHSLGGVLPCGPAPSIVAQGIRAFTHCLPTDPA